MNAVANAAKAARAALKHAFPKHKISVTSSSDICLRWTDDGPSVEQVQEILLAAGCAEARIGWNGNRYLNIPDAKYKDYWFDCFNAAERAAEQQKREQERAEHEARCRRENEAVAAAWRAKNNAVAPVVWQQPPAIKDPTAFDAFERLRLRAESDLAGDAERSRRPTWAPPMILGEELALACLGLGYLTEDDKWIGRLWATFASPKRSGQYLREHVSSLPLSGIACRGFQFHVGEVRGPTHQILFEAQRTATTEWRFGPDWYPILQHWKSPRAREWEKLVREREGEERDQARVAELTRQINAIDAEDLKNTQAFRDRQQKHGRVLELARARVLNFIGAPDVQMQLAGRLWGHCCICGKELTDPISLERGIGPECIRHRVDAIKAFAASGHSLEHIALLAGMPIGFVTAVLNERVVEEA